MSTDNDNSTTHDIDHADAPTSSTDAQPRRATDTKRVLACKTCRKRKLKCDSKRPDKCTSCARLGHPCEYDDVRKKSGPKRGYVKSLEARLNQLENLLDHNPQPSNETSTAAPSAPRSSIPIERASMPAAEPSRASFDAVSEAVPEIFSVDFSWDMVSLGLEEPLPDQDIMNELYQIFFDKVHPSIPMVHRPRFLASLSSAPNSRPPVCLRYIMFAHACSVSSQYSSSAEQFYIKARKYVEQDEMRGHGESFITVQHAQCWNMIATYEFKNMYFPRAWLSVGRAGRLVQMLGLYRQDRVGPDVKQTLAPAKDWIEREERRRTFWVAYCQDRYASIGTGWPMMVEEKDILTALPASDEAFLKGSPEKTQMLSDIMNGDRGPSLSSYGSVILLATLFGRNLTHLHRPSANDDDHDLNGEFWRRHRSLDNILLNTALSLPSHLRLPQGLNDPNIVFSNMNIHTSTICLHQAAIFKADKFKLAAQIGTESKRRCLVAAGEVTSIMRMVSHQDLSGLNPFLAFCLYVAARVFVQYLKFKKDDHTVKSSLVFLLHAMQAFKTQNPLTESFLLQLDVDLESSGLDIPLPMAGVPLAQRTHFDGPLAESVQRCSPLFDIRDGVDPSSKASQPATATDPQHTHYEIPPYFATRRSDDAIPSNSRFTQIDLSPPSFSNGEMSSSRSQSGHPTPSSSSNTRTSIDMGMSPKIENNMSQHRQAQKPNSIKVSDLFNYTEGPAKFPSPMAGQSSMGTQSNAISQSNNTDSNNIQQDFMDFDFGSTGMTPGATGFTPGASGTGMTPFSEWQNLANPQNNGWMYNG